MCLYAQIHLYAHTQQSATSYRAERAGHSPCSMPKAISASVASLSPCGSLVPICLIVGSYLVLSRGRSQSRGREMLQQLAEYPVLQWRARPKMRRGSSKPRSELCGLQQSPQWLPTDPTASRSAARPHCQASGERQSPPTAPRLVGSKRRGPDTTRRPPPSTREYPLRMHYRATVPFCESVPKIAVPLIFKGKGKVSTSIRKVRLHFAMV